MGCSGCLPPRGQRQPWQARPGQEQPRALALHAEDQRRLHDGRVQRQGEQQVVGRLLAAVIGRLRVLVGAQRRNLQHAPHAGVGAGVEKRMGAAQVKRVEALRAVFAKDADRVDDDVDVAQMAAPVGGGRGGDVERQPLAGGRSLRNVARDADDLVAARQQGAAQATADESAGPGDQDFHE